jgi:hypothetical protein
VCPAGQEEASPEYLSSERTIRSIPLPCLFMRAENAMFIHPTLAEGFFSLVANVEVA